VAQVEFAPRQSAGRVPPHNLEAEESLLGAMLLSRDAISAATEVGVETADFYKPAHAHIFDAVLSLYAQGEPVDPVTVADELGRVDLLDQLGGRKALMRLQAQTPASANASHYAHIVNELALLRRLIAVAGEISEMGYDASGEVADTLDRAEALVFEVAERRVSDSMTGVSDALQDALDQLEALYGSDGDITGVETGYVDLDSLLLGLQPSNLVVVAARPGCGKCVAWDTPIVDARTGELRTVAEMHRVGAAGDDVCVLALDNDHKLRPVVPSAFVDDGIKPVFRVRTRTGRRIRTTSTHPFLTPRGWVPLSEVSVGSRVAVPRSVPVFGDAPLPEHEVSLLGLLTGAAALVEPSAGSPPNAPARSAPRITTPSPEVLTELHRCASALGARIVSLAEGDCTLDGSDEHPGVVAELCRRHGLRRHQAAEARVPPAVFRLPRAHLSQFLNRVFAVGGTIAAPADGQGGIELGAASEQLVRDVAHLLLRFGIIGRVRERRATSEGSPGAWVVRVSDAESVRRWCTEVGSLGKEAAVARAEGRARSRLQNPRSDTLPVDVWERILEGPGSRSWSSIAQLGGRPRGGDAQGAGPAPQRGTIALLADVLGSVELADRTESDVLWDEIVEIEPDGDDQVYDLTVPELHNFVAGDVFVHNTAFALGAASNVAMTARRPVLFFSMEMGTLELTKRLLAGEARVEMRNLQTGKIREDEWTRLSHAVGRLAEAPLFIDDNPHCTVMEMRAKARRTKARHGDLGLVVVDYLQLMTPSVTRRMENRQVEVAEISRGLKILARELECPVVALSQLNRQLEYRADKRPMLADLRESGSLEQDSDVVIFLYRDEIYNPDTDQRGTAEVIVSKHRNGPTGTTRLAFLDTYTKFANMARG
jgi:replicative DNA helicase